MGGTPPEDARLFVAIANALGRATRPGTLTTRLTAAVGDLRTFFEASACSIALVAADGQRLRFVAANGVGADSIVGVELPLSRGIAGWVAMAGQSIVVSDVAADPRFARDVAESTQYLPTTIMAAPLLGADEEVVGVVEVLDPTSAVPPATGLALLGVIGRQVAAISELSGHFDRLGAALLAPHLDPLEHPDPDAMDGGEPQLDRLVELFGELAALSPRAQQLTEAILAAVRAYATARP